MNSNDNSTVAAGLLEIISLGKCETTITEDDTKKATPIERRKKATTVLDGSKDSTRSIGIRNIAFNLLGRIIQKIFDLALSSDTIRGMITSVAFPFLSLNKVTDFYQ